MSSHTWVGPQEVGRQVRHRPVLVIAVTDGASQPLEGADRRRQVEIEIGSVTPPFRAVLGLGLLPVALATTEVILIPLRLAITTTSVIIAVVLP